MIVIGIDEAGRGPVIGPMVMVGFAIDDKAEKQLRKMGVKDSKQLSPEKRENLATELREMGQFAIRRIWPAQIDAGNLNRLEKDAVRGIVAELEGDRVIIDGFEKHLEQKLNLKDIEVISEFKADEKYPIVSAASIIAKTERDHVVAELRKEHGDFGSGYPSDPKTRAFLKSWFKQNKQWPDFVRRSWGTARQMVEKIEQARITDF
ncbi:MAG: ribonuclease HII [Candidatus Altiarchaeota archaeon]|nr:ribonuclease HII [Candidatus Altiarchaeota archaeon]